MVSSFAIPTRGGENGITKAGDTIDMAGNPLSGKILVDDQLIGWS
jgi:hypothetical protein